jgi:hypothetical protein
MTLLSSILDGGSFNELDSSLLLRTGPGLTISHNNTVNGLTYVASPTAVGLATYDQWIGTTGNPDPSDIIAYNTTISDDGRGIIQYTFTSGDGTVTPGSGGIGAEVVAQNATGYLLETLNGYVPGPNPVINLSGRYLILENSTVNLATKDANGNFIGEQATLAERTFNGIPEPSIGLLMPVLLIGLMVARIPAVRSFLGGAGSVAGAH